MSNIQEKIKRDISDFEERVSNAVEEKTGKKFTFVFSYEAREEICKQIQRRKLSAESALKTVESQILEICCQDFDDDITFECTSIELNTAH
ncbi:MAG: hypothetical protein RLZZ76_438 [Candidatus Parcubacteria bacterium]|jgi:hypothetical protein